MPFAALVGAMLNSSPSKGVPKNESLNPSVSTVVVPVLGLSIDEAVNVHKLVFWS